MHAALRNYETLLRSIYSQVEASPDFAADLREWLNRNPGAHDSAKRFDEACGYIAMYIEDGQRLDDAALYKVMFNTVAGHIESNYAKIVGSPLGRYRSQYEWVAAIQNRCVGRNTGLGIQTLNAAAGVIGASGSNYQQMPTYQTPAATIVGAATNAVIEGYNSMQPARHAPVIATNPTIPQPPQKVSNCVQKMPEVDHEVIDRLSDIHEGVANICGQFYFTLIEEETCHTPVISYVSRGIGLPIKNVDDALADAIKSLSHVNDIGELSKELNRISRSSPIENFTMWLDVKITRIIFELINYRHNKRKPDGSLVDAKSYMKERGTIDAWMEKEGIREAVISNALGHITELLKTCRVIDVVDDSAADQPCSIGKICVVEEVVPTLSLPWLTHYSAKTETVSAAGASSDELYSVLDQAFELANDASADHAVTKIWMVDKANNGYNVYRCGTSSTKNFGGVDSYNYTIYRV